MRLFLIAWADGLPELVDAAATLQGRSHQILYWVLSANNRKAIAPERFPHTIFHDLEDALALRPAPEVDEATFAPPGEDLLEQLYEEESTVLTMMNKKYEWMGVLERKHFYYQLVRYWHGVLRQYAPDAIVFPVTPHTVFDYVIYGLARLLGIKTVMFDFTRIGDRLLMMNDYKAGSRALEQEFLRQPATAVLSESLSEDIREYYRQQIDQAFDNTPPDTKTVLGRQRLWLLARTKIKSLWKSFFTFNIFKFVLQYTVRLFQGNLKREYAAVQQRADFAQKYVYVPLSYQPECSTSPLGGIFVDQILMIEILSHSLPAGWCVYVKEHPGQWIPRGLKYFDYRYRGYYRAISRLKNVCVVPAKTSTFDLIEHSQAVATTTGTAGWEALFRRKSVLVFGYPWYRHCSGIFKVNNVATCQAALRAIEQRVGTLVQPADMLKYLAGFDAASFHGYLDAYGRHISKLSPQENASNILQALTLAIEK